MIGRFKFRGWLANSQPETDERERGRYRPKKRPAMLPAGLSTEHSDRFAALRRTVDHATKEGKAS